ncbi:hypothetical protein Pst134EA_029079 [Puccinia striiformis f. sp. tritici]|uniref:hypothetical protein n=1 Tax=Puccinia striiformis f. sp. tritici TaxID=168172 RepID=UPI00200744C6|nr:hypothetical protein Pst134EA_029079 [Puccinia striiformis f. sp. tritici]KAH9447092.1 hypothetical protein Pst134EA_029079 [Puccinia striiformis f. sp. tritici]
MGPTESFIAFSGRARVLQSLINFDDSLPPSSDSKLPSTIVTHLTDFDLAEFVVLGVKNEAIHGDIAKFAPARCYSVLLSGIRKTGGLF